jgi:hypothetical protein
MENEKQQTNNRHKQVEAESMNLPGRSAEVTWAIMKLADSPDTVREFETRPRKREEIVLK